MTQDKRLNTVLLSRGTINILLLHREVLRRYFNDVTYYFLVNCVLNTHEHGDMFGQRWQGQYSVPSAWQLTSPKVECMAFEEKSRVMELQHGAS